MKFLSQLRGQTHRVRGRVERVAVDQRQSVNPADRQVADATDVALVEGVEVDPADLQLRVVERRDVKAVLNIFRDAGTGWIRSRYGPARCRIPGEQTAELIVERR